MYNRTIIISDIHGCLDEFDEFLKTIQYSKTDRIICTGDLIDRGPDSQGVVRRVMEIGADCVMGNHEFKFLKWLKGNRFIEHQKNYSQFSDAEINFINNMPKFIKLDEANIVVHAGIKPNLKIESQRNDDLMYLRYTDKNRKFISLKKIFDVGKEQSEAVFWTEFGPFGYNVYYGHNVYSMTEPKIDSFFDGTKTYGLDTGCCFGGRLTGIIHETKEIVQVQAKKEYYKSHFDI